MSLQPFKQDSCQSSADTQLGDSPTQKESTSHFDYFEKFTLLDEAVPGEQAAEPLEDAEQPTSKPQVEEQKPAKEAVSDSPSASEESFVFVTDVEIVGEHLDEVFYGEGTAPDALQQREDDEEEARMRSRRESQRSMKESGSVLFEKEETILTPIYISAGPPKIIDPILLEEPTAMSFMYSDLYEDAVGERRRSDEEYSEAESVASEKTYKRRLSDSDEADGYLEKFILKDDTPTVEAQPESVEDMTEGRMMFLQNKFEMTGCLTRVVEEENEDKKEELKMQEISGSDSDELKSAEFEQKRALVTENEMEKTQFPTETEEQAVKEASEISVQESDMREAQMDDREMKYEVKRDQRDPPESSTNEPFPENLEKTEKSGEHQRQKATITEAEQPSQTHKVMRSTEEVAKATDETATKPSTHSELPAIVVKSEIQTEATETNLSEEAATKMVATDEKEASEAKAEASAEWKESEIVRQMTEPSGETETWSETLTCEEKDAAAVVPEDVEVITDCGSAVQAVVAISEKAVREKEIQTQVQIDLQEVTSAESTAVHKALKENEESTAESKLTEIFSETAQDSEFKTEVTKAVMSEYDNTGSHKDESHEILKPVQHQQISESDKTNLMTEVKATTPTEDNETAVQETMTIEDDLILLVPKGQTVEMDVNIGQWSDKTASVVVAPPEPVVSPHGDPRAHSEKLPMEETMPEPLLEVEPEVAVKTEEVATTDSDRVHLSSTPVEEANAEEQKTERDMEEDEGIFSTLRSFPPQVDLSEQQREAVQPDEADTAQKTETHQVEDTSEAKIFKEHQGSDVHLHREDVRQEREQDVEAAEAPEVSIDELEYEIISKQDAKDIIESETQRDTEKSRAEYGQDREERMEVEMEGKEFGLSLEEELIEADYEIIDEEEESQARMVAELQGMDWFCLTCGCLLSQENHMCGEHRSHEVKAVDNVYEEIKVVYQLDACAVLDVFGTSGNLDF